MPKFRMGDLVTPTSDFKAFPFETIGRVTMSPDTDPRLGTIWVKWLGPGAPSCDMSGYRPHILKKITKQQAKYLQLGSL